MAISMERDLSEYLDSLLVDAEIENPRRQVPTGKPDGSLRWTTPARIKVRFVVSDNPRITPHFTVTYKDADCSFSLIDGSPLKSKLPLKMLHILRFVAQMWIEKREEIIQVCKTKMGLQLANNDEDEDDDKLPCDGMYVSPAHKLGARRRKWREK